MTTIPIDEYCSLLKTIHNSQLKQKEYVKRHKVQKELLRNDMSELLEPTTKAIEEQTKSLESGMDLQTKAIENKFHDQLAILGEQEKNLRNLTIQRPSGIEYPEEYEEYEEGAIASPEEYKESAMPLAEPKKLKESQSKMSINFDSALNEYEDLYHELKVPKLMDILNGVLNINDNEERITKMKSTQNAFKEKFSKITSSFGGMKRGLEYDLDQKDKLRSFKTKLEKTKLDEEIKNVKKEIAEIERRKEFISVYKMQLKNLASGINDPKTFQIQRGKGISGVVHFYNNFDELVERLEVLYGHIVGGNNSIDILNESNEIIDILLKNKIITKIQYRKLYKKVSKHK